MHIKKVFAEFRNILLAAQTVLLFRTAPPVVVGAKHLELHTFIIPFRFICGSSAAWKKQQKQRGQELKIFNPQTSPRSRHSLLLLAYHHNSAIIAHRQEEGARAQPPNRYRTKKSEATTAMYVAVCCHEARPFSATIRQKQMCRISRNSIDLSALSPYSINS